ncbi:formimidoylglutamate deiminase [Bremerella sp. JC770]|uniref:formimidoylglutamate deiminase n=1 Tax=Bremerella sp. JC770 TaxID=3232137 RepID=UPI00345B153B
MATIWASQALLGNGWAKNVEVQVNEVGQISSVRTDTQPVGLCVETLLPAPVNAHGHAFQRAMAGMTEYQSRATSDSFWTWRQQMYRFLACLTPEHIEAIASYAQMEMLEAGFATSIEFHYLHHQPSGQPYENLGEMAERIAAATKMSGIGLLLLPVLYQYGGCDQRTLSEGQRRFGNSLDHYFTLHAASHQAVQGLPVDCRVGYAAHSLRAVSANDLLEIEKASDGKPIHLHLAEQQGEVDEVQTTYGLRPVEWALQNLSLSPQYCLIHCTQMLPHEISQLAQTRAVVGLCPITEANLGDGIFDAKRWCISGGTFAVGSDSHVHVSLSEELRTLEYSQRLKHMSRNVLGHVAKSTGRHLFEEVVRGGAIAAGRRTGEIIEGMWGDLIALESPPCLGMDELKGDRMLDYFVFAGDSRMIREVWSAGRHLVQNGCHIRSEHITERYRSTIRELRDSI